MPLVRTLPRLSLLAALATTALAPALVGLAQPAHAATCSDVEVIFARGSGEPQGLGSLGTPFVQATTRALSGKTVSSYAVQYAASYDQSSAGAGGTDMSRHLRATAASCPGTRFVLAGYSQGATATDIALGIRTGFSSGEAVPADLASRVSAVVVFGNPLGLSGGRTIATSSPTYGARSRDFCNSGDTVCGSQPKTGSGSHLSYQYNGAVGQAAQFVAGKVG